MEKYKWLFLVLTALVYNRGFSQCVSISGKVFYDGNNDDMYGAGDGGINGLRVTLERNVSGFWIVQDNQFTTHLGAGYPGLNGHYDFTPGCPPSGTYRLRFDQAGSLPACFQDVGSHLTDSDIDRSTFLSPVFTASVGQTVDTIYAGFQPIEVTTLTCNAPSPASAYTCFEYNGTFRVDYTGGNGPSTISMSENSTGVTGLTAEINGQSFLLGSGFFTFTVTGTPSGTGNAFFNISFGGQTCMVTLPVLDGTLTSLDCASAVFSPIELIRGVNYSYFSTSINIPYTGGNGQSYSQGSPIAAIPPSVPGINLNARLDAGTLNVGSGNVTFSFEGRPTDTGWIYWPIDFGCRQCTVQIHVRPPELDGLNCAGAIFSPATMSVGVPYAGTMTIPYTGGKGGSYAAQSFSNNGITASLPAGTFNVGSGTLVYNLSGTPTSIGTFSGFIIIGDQSCLVSNPVVCGTKPQPPTGTNSYTICQGQSQSMLVSSLGSNTISWHATNNSGSPVLSTSNPYIVSPSSTTTYYAFSDSGGNCISDSSLAVTVNVNPRPSAPTGTSSYTICQGQNQNISVTLGPGETVSWHSTNNPLSPVVSTSNPYLVSPSSTTTYYAFANSSLGCRSSSGLAVTVNVNPRPSSPTGTSSYSICQGENQNISVTLGPGETVSWHTTNNPLSPVVSTSNPYLVSPSSTSTYYAFANSSLGCRSSSGLAVTVNVNPRPSAPTGTSSYSICQGQSQNISVMLGPGENVSWHLTNNPLSPVVSTSNPYLVSPSSTSTYYAFANSSLGCRSSSSLAVTVNVNIVSTPTISSPTDTICQGTSTILSATCSGSTVHWFQNNAGSGMPFLVGSGINYTPTINDTLFAFCYDSSTSCQGLFYDSIIIIVETCTDTIISYIPSNGCSDTTVLSTSGIPGGPNFIGSCMGDSLTYNGDTINFINDSTFALTPSTLPYLGDSACIIMCNTTIPLCDTIIVYFLPDTGMPSVSPPIVNCINDTVYISNGGIAVVLPGQVSTINYECLLEDTSYLSQDTFTCADTGVNTVWVYAINNFGGIDSCQTTITVWDTVKPNMVCQNITVYLDAFGAASITASDVDGGTTDNCAIQSLNVFPNTFSCIDTGINNVTLIATDVNGNIDSCTATVTVVDTIAPSIVCSSATLYLDSLGNLQVDTTGLITSVNDNCGVDSVWVKSSDTLLSCVHLGNYQATIYVQDIHGNIDSCFSSLTIIDTNLPVAICMDTTVYLDATGQVIIDSSFINNGSYAICSSLAMSLSQSVFSCNDIGVNNVTLVVTDSLGRSDSCVALVTILDTASPTVLCPNDTNITLIDTCEYVVPDFSTSLSYYDNCSGVTPLIFNQTPPAGTIISVGSGATIVQPIDILITDGSSNIATCLFNINLSCLSFRIPQFFSPNGDGKNDTWEIPGIESYPNDIKIFNRWGNIVFNMENYDNSWAGESNTSFKVSGDGVLPSATYFYIVTIELSPDVFETYTGYLFMRK